MFYLWAGREFGWTMAIVDKMTIGDFLDLYLLCDKVNHPDEYLPADYFFKP